eukprot:2100758-Pyramimonas_sp.AAC.2
MVVEGKTGRQRRKGQEVGPNDQWPLLSAPRQVGLQQTVGMGLYSAVASPGAVGFECAPAAVVCPEECSAPPGRFSGEYRSACLRGARFGSAPPLRARAGPARGQGHGPWSPSPASRDGGGAMEAPLQARTTASPGSGQAMAVQSLLAAAKAGLNNDAAS